MSNQLPVVQLAVAVPGVQGPAGPSWPSGGTTGQVLAKQSNANSDFVWQQISDANVASGAEIAVSKLADGNARQLLQTDSAGAGVEWTSNVDIPGTLDVTGATRLDSTLSVPLGSAAAPSIYPGTDTNTGIYSPGADQVAISTNGTARVYVDGSGNVGIGTTSPVSIFDVTVGASGTRKFLVNYDDSVITIKGSNGSSDPENLRLIADSLRFNTGTVGSGTERVRIDSSGNVGIGTTNPVSALNISVADGGNVTISNTNDGHAGGLAFGDTSSNTSGRVSYDHFNDAMRFDTAGNERVRIDSSGNVGIGSTAPLTTLECRGQFSISNVATSFWVLDRDDADGRFKLLDSSTSTNERLAVDSSGRLLVGTSSDSGGALLQVNGNRIRIATAKTPASASDTGTAGEICWDADYIYVCTATNTWKRTAIATW